MSMFLKILERTEKEFCTKLGVFRLKAKGKSKFFGFLHSPAQIQHSV